MGNGKVNTNRCRWHIVLSAVLVFLSSFSADALRKPSGGTEIKETELQEVVVRPKRQKYTKKGNPAYELMQEIRKSASKHNPRNRENYSYRFHDKTVLGFNNMEIGDTSARHYGFLSRYADTAANTGRPVVLFSIKEKIGEFATQHNPDKEKTIIRDRNNHGIDEAFDQENINKILEDVLREVDIYGNDITLMQQRFVSPLSRIAGDYYHYYITDTVSFPNDERKFIELSFSPVNPESFGFNGRLYVADDSTRYIKKATMRIPNAINLNYVDNIFINQEFMLDSLGFRHKVLDQMSIDLQIIPGTPSFYAERIASKTDFNYARRADLAKYLDRMGSVIEIDESEGQNPDDLWNEMRIVSLNEAESSLVNIHEEMKKSPIWYWAEKVVVILAKGYIGTSPGVYPSKFDLGPVNTLISYDSLEGVRLRAGGMTTASLSPHLFGRMYVAYGFRDHRWKYLVEGEYSFNKKKLHSREFPVHSIRATHKYDVDMLGQHYLFTNADNVFLSFKRKESYLATYQRLSQLEYTLELHNNFSLVAGFRHQIQFATRFVPFITGLGHSIPHFSQSAFFIQLRFAPGEVFYQGRSNRLPINMDSPIIQLTHEFGPKGMLGSAYTLNITELSVQKRFWFSAFGYLDLILKGGKIWSKVQYPSLLWPNANLSYTIQPESYSLMNPMEFANDWYGALDLTYWLNGLIFNRIPLIKKAKLREIFTFKLLTGGLTKKNNPTYDDNLYRFPYNAETHILGKTPYMEIGAGIDNILTILRVDYVWRITYRNLPGISKSGLRVSLHFNF